MPGTGPRFPWFRERIKVGLARGRGSVTLRGILDRADPFSLYPTRQEGQCPRVRTQREKKREGWREREREKLGG